MKKLFLAVFAFAAFAMTGCEDNDPKPQKLDPQKPDSVKPETKEKTLENATLFFSSKSGYVEVDRHFYVGKILALKEDGSWVSDAFEKANPKDKIGFIVPNALSVKGNKVYVSMKTKHNNNESQLFVLDNKTLKIEKRIELDAVEEGGISLTAKGMHIVSEKKAYLFLDDAIFIVDLEAGKIGKKLEGVGAGYQHSNNIPFYEINGKLYSVFTDSYTWENNLFVIDPVTDIVKTINIGGDNEPKFLMKGAGNKLVVICEDFDTSTLKELLVVSVDEGKIIQTKELTNPVGKAMAISPDEPIIFYNGTYGGNSKNNKEKIIYKFNYETDKSEVFTEVETKNPQYISYKMCLAVHPKTKKLIVGVHDSFSDSFVRIYNSKTTALPATHEDEFKINSGLSGVSEIVFNIEGI